ncbi:hypothetical protein [Pseudonocardia sediminis]
MWHRVAPVLVEQATVVATDLRGSVPARHPGRTRSMTPVG